jgi:hypothetical protein
LRKFTYNLRKLAYNLSKLPYNLWAWTYLLYLLYFTYNLWDLQLWKFAHRAACDKSHFLAQCFS